MPGLEQWSLVVSFLQWLESIGAASFNAVLAPLIVVALAVPLIVVASLLLVALMTPSHRQPGGRAPLQSLERKRGAGWFSQRCGRIGYTLLALLALVLTMPLWFVPPLVLVLPPLIWGWLTYKVMTFDVLADHATTRAPGIDARHRAVAGHGHPDRLPWRGALAAVGGERVPLVLRRCWWWCRSGSTRLSSRLPRSGSRTRPDRVAGMRQRETDESDRTLTSPPLLRHLHGGQRDGAASAPTMGFGLMIVGDEILSGKRADKHVPRSSSCWRRAVWRCPGPATPVTTEADHPGPGGMRLPAPTSCSPVAASVRRRTTTRGNAPRRRWACRWCCTLAPAIWSSSACARWRPRRACPSSRSGRTLHRLNMGVFPEGAALIPTRTTRPRASWSLRCTSCRAFR